eukprot:evm.model.scf_333.3 EVM.evm.TU.scf_333.3   scf_333:44572-47481(-)
MALWPSDGDHLVSLTSGPVISATRHKPLRLGQRLTGPPSSAGRRPEGKQQARGGGEGRERERERKRKPDGRRPTDPRPSTPKRQKSHHGPQQAEAAVQKKEARNSVTTSAVKRRGPLQLKDLIESRVLTPGRNKVTVQYKGMVYTASLGKDGAILFEGRKFQAASAFSVHVKRLLTPNKQGDDGWKSVHIDGRPLEDWREDYFQKHKLAEQGGEKTTRSRQHKSQRDQRAQVNVHLPNALIVFLTRC